METSTLKKHEIKWFEDGKAEGEQEKAEAIARNLLKMGIEAEAVARATSLSIEEIQSLV